jgi:phosphohistidine swiveling domain-containing protein
MDAQQGQPTAAATAIIQRAVADASARFGPSELEWAAQGDHVTFLQWRPFHAARAATADQTTPDDDDGWTWDATHNPAPLSPAQAGLVALVDERCPTGLRQQVRGGYLFFARATPPAEDSEGPPLGPRAMFDRLAAEVDARLRALTDPPRLEPALDLYLAAYTPLFGAIQPACSRARAALKEFLGRAFLAGEASAAALTAGVACAASRRATLATAIADAPDTEARQAATDAYLRAFGDESPRWDVAEPTYREAPERLLFLGSSSSGARALPAGPSGLTARESEAALAARLPPDQRPVFAALVSAARDAVAVGEDDDHLFARLQAVVRRALLALGQRLVAAGRLTTVDDVFYLPLSLARTLDDETHAALDLRAQAEAGRRTFRAAAAAPPALPGGRAGARPLLQGLGGSPGRVMGRVVHHPPTAPLTADAVLIAVTLLPTELPLLAPAALVVETGSPLGHVAAQARERGIPAVVAVPGARAAFREGQRLIVDGTRGQLTLVED